MNFEQQEALITENKALKSQVSVLREALVSLFNGGWDDEHTQLITKQVTSALKSTSE